ncbi:ABC transporter substrate-binding protein [Hymenobacter latericus]|uniref:ABC transporter substrate-binding protein n=1 Tax=Hymenobacter sp. YIM 151858-1 TaxID=2987688 RepID=UPI00222785C3|nr:ABC transporter substrate-binding protein [Hymenobacter sp. YIM 151858-1]UYZ59080.1 ABC transporter substrate-binding protein [Hymenobacter sp. YIM 151858-1]
MLQISLPRLLVALSLCVCCACSSSPSKQAAVPTAVRVCWPRDPESLNPVTLPNAYAIQLNNLLYQSLLTVDGAKRRFVPWLATDMPSVRRTDSLTYISYQLHPEATWDNGRPVLASDVVFSLKVIACPGLPNESLRNTLGFVQDVQLDAQNPRRFTLVCRGYAPEYRTTSGDFPVLPEYLLDPDSLLRALPVRRLLSGDSTLNQVAAVQAFQQRFGRGEQWRDPRVVRGSGAYQLVSWQAGQRVVLERKSKWWGDALKNAASPLVANPRRLEFHVVPNAATALLAMRRGELDVYPNMPGPDFEQLRKTDSAGFQLYSPASYRVVVMEINTQQPSLSESRTRQALALLVDAQRLMQATQFGLGQRSTSLISPREQWVYHDSLPLRPYSPQQAVALLQQAGWQRGSNGWRRAGNNAQALAPRLFYAAGDRTYETIGLLLQQAARQIGLPISLHPTEAGQLSALRREGNFDLCLRTLYGNPFSYDLRPLLHTGSIGEGGVNRTRFGNAASDRLLDGIVNTEDSARKVQLLHKLQTVLYQQMPMVPLFFEPNRLAVARRFGNVRPSGLEPGYDLPAFTLTPGSRP